MRTELAQLFVELDPTALADGLTQPVTDKESREAIRWSRSSQPSSSLSSQCSSERVPSKMHAKPKPTGMWHQGPFRSSVTHHSLCRMLPKISAILKPRSGVEFLSSNTAKIPSPMSALPYSAILPRFRTLVDKKLLSF
jgi:hypothetical protein